MAYEGSTQPDDAVQSEVDDAQSPMEATGKKVSKKKASTKKRAKKKSKASESSKSASSRRPGPKPYPVMTFAEALTIGEGILRHAAGHPIKRTTLLTKLKLSRNQPTKNLITASSKYRITQGSHDSDELRLTTAGSDAVAQRPSIKRAQTRFELSIKNIPHFRSLYDQYKGGRMPAPEVMRDALTDLNVGDRPQCVDLFISNAKTVGILQTRDGANHLLSIDDFVEQVPGQGAPVAPESSGEGEVVIDVPKVERDFAKVCFFMAPIGDEGTEHRQHSDSILSSFVEPALQEHGLEIVRADRISKPGMISGQIIEYIIRSKLVVADLSFHNPNVFYELSLRHATGLPTVHIIRESDTIPFDVGNFRTIAIKMDSVYNVLAQLETHRAEIAQQIRQVLADGVSTDNPILTYCPDHRFLPSAG